MGWMFYVIFGIFFIVLNFFIIIDNFEVRFFINVFFLLFVDGISLVLKNDFFILFLYCVYVCVLVCECRWLERSEVLDFRDLMIY